MRIAPSILLVLGTLAGGVSGYQIASTAVTPGTYYVDIDRAVAGAPAFEAMRAQRMGPIQALGDEWNARKTQLEEDAAGAALLEEGSAEYRAMSVSLAIREENLKSEYKVLSDAAGQVNEGLAFEAQRMIQTAVEVLGAEKGYEHIVISPLTNEVIPWDNANAARDLLRTRTTFWIHPERDVTAEVVEILNR
jgi:Skp family chaperone for outer membrane proteins